VRRGCGEQRPLALRPGDRVRVVAPAGPFERERFERGVALLATRYRPVYGDEVFARARYHAGADAERLAGMDAALRDQDARAVLCARGGYGASCLLPHLDLDRHPPQLLVGFSDVTALHLLWQAHGRVSVHGPVVAGLAEQPDEVVQRLFALLESPAPPPPLEGTAALVGGTAEGPLVGGNLSLLTSLLGTPYLPAFDGAILLLEDVGERPYRIDRMWTHLALARVLDRLSGIVLGQFTRCAERDPDHTVEEVLADLATATGLPCVAGLPVGHGPRNEPLPLGVRVRLDADARRLTFLEAAVEGVS
jgi:muramoyltetrapeptide carboxypeptidase